VFNTLKFASNQMVTVRILAELIANALIAYGVVGQGNNAS
jgi:hypothetical protein